MKKYFITVICTLVSVLSFAQGNIFISAEINDTNVAPSLNQIIEDIFQEHLITTGYNVRVSRDFGPFEKEREKELRYQNSGAVSIEEAIAPGNEMPVGQLCLIYVERINKEYYFRAKVFDLETKKLYKTAAYPGAEDPSIYDLTNLKTLQVTASKLVAKLGYNKTNAISLANDFEKSQKEISKKNKRDANATALAYSLIPGVGLMKKGHKTEGTIYLVSDIALLGCGLGLLAYSNNQQAILNNKNSTFEQYNTAKNNYNIAKSVSYCCFGAAATLYCVNLIRSYFARPTIDGSIQWAIAPSIYNSSYGDSNMSINFALIYKF